MNNIIKQEDCELFKELDILVQETRKGKGILGDVETLVKRYKL